MEDEQTRKIPLSQTEAEMRKSLLLNSENNLYYVHYDLAMVIRRSTDKNLKHSDAEYEGKLTCKFNYHPKQNVQNSEGLFLEFTGTILSLHINGNREENFKHVNHKLVLDQTKLRSNVQNEVTVLFNAKYNHGGVGLHHYIDPIDKKEYLYTQFEPYDCHQMFPCFDQPDIKAYLELSVIAPAEWVVLSNEHEKWAKVFNNDTLNDLDIKRYVDSFSEEDRVHLFTNTEVLTKNYNLHLFNRTPRISSYLFALCAGHYYCINCPIEYEVPLRIFCRESLKKSGDPLEMFKITIEGMEWYRDFFGIKYPFNKYDQIFCPEYNMGAMGNVGLVTFNEVFCFKETPTQRLKTNAAITVLHELAHMWFGNLVTMKWWNDLWLNESFATFISHLCLSEAKGLKHYTTSWLLFNNFKGYAYSADQKSTTHPVMGEVKNTEVAETHFDEIVYEKGSSILQQLFKFIGFDNFSKGIRNYFQIYKWENTEFNDFIRQMVGATGNQNLNNLCDNFLRKAGLTEVSASWEVSSDNKISSFTVNQTACLSQHNNLQHHLCDVLLIYGKGTTHVVENVNILPQTTTTLSQFNGLDAPDAVILNYNDWAYFKLSFDQHSIRFLQNNLFNQSLDLSPLVRQIFLRSLFDNTRDSVISGVQYIDVVSKLLPQESNNDLISVMLRNLEGVLAYYIPLKYYSKYQQVVYDLVINLLQRPGQTEDSLKTILNNLINLTSPAHEQQVALLKKWLESGLHLEKVNLNQNLLQQKMRFNALTKIFASTFYSTEEKNLLLEAECKRDNNSDDSELTRFQCRAALPDKAVKEELWNTFVNESTKESLYKMISSMLGFVQRNQLELTQDYQLNKFAEVVLSVGKKNEHQYTDSFISYLFPILFVQPDVIEKMEQLVLKAESDSVRRALSENTDDLKRFYRSHQLCEKYLSEQQK